MRHPNRDNVDDNSRLAPPSIDPSCQTANVLAEMQADLKHKDARIEALIQKAEDRSQEVRRLNRNDETLLENLQAPWFADTEQFREK